MGWGTETDTMVLYGALMLTLVAGLQLDLATVVAMATLGAGPHAEHVGRSRLEAIYSHHVGLGLQHCVVLVSLILIEKETSLEISVF